MAIAHVNSNTANGNSDTVSVSRPTGSGSGDLLIWTVRVYSGSTTFSDPSGWTNIGGADFYLAGAEANMRSKIFFKISDGSESPSVTLSASRDWSTSISAYSGVDQTTPINTTEGTGWSIATGGTGAVTTTAITASSDQWLVSVVCGAHSSSNTWTDNRTERTDVSTPSFGGTISAADSNGTVTGSVTTEFTPSVSIASSRAVSMLVTPASSSTSANAGHSAVTGTSNSSTASLLPASGGPSASTLGNAPSSSLGVNAVKYRRSA